MHRDRCQTKYLLRLYKVTTWEGPAKEFLDLSSLEQHRRRRDGVHREVIVVLEEASERDVVLGNGSWTSREGSAQSWLVRVEEGISGRACSDSRCREPVHVVGRIDGHVGLEERRRELAARESAQQRRRSQIPLA
jgi:hypothetical protein